MDPKQVMGFETPDDKKMPVRLGDWNAMKRAMWRSKMGWERVAEEAEKILADCKHADGCPALHDETASCLGGGIDLSSIPVTVDAVAATDEPAPLRMAGKVDTRPNACPDREKRLSALVILNAARQFAEIDARQPAEGHYFAPSREHYSAVMSELGATQIALDELRAQLAVTTKGTP